jgi:hypothetical protein
LCANGFLPSAPSGVGLDFVNPFQKDFCQLIPSILQIKHIFTISTWSLWQHWSSIRVGRLYCSGWGTYQIHTTDNMTIKTKTKFQLFRWYIWHFRKVWLKMPNRDYMQFLITSLSQTLIVEFHFWAKVFHLFEFF